MMRLILMLGAALLATLCLLVPGSNATALTYKLHANEKQCFYINNEKTQAKVAFYFAVCEFLRVLLELVFETS